MENVKYYAFVVTMAERLSPLVDGDNAIRDRALDRLAKAVWEEGEARGQCRDTDVQAAVRVRPWGVT